VGKVCCSWQLASRLVCLQCLFKLICMLCLRLQVSEAELEAIARMGEGATLEAELATGAGGEATRQLLGEYQTPAR
jgi:hypothetical protein